jgi:hypothetical protein
MMQLSLLNTLTWPGSGKLQSIKDDVSLYRQGYDSN